MGDPEFRFLSGLNRGRAARTLTKGTSMINWAKRQAVKTVSWYWYAGSLVYTGCCTGW